MQSGIGFQQPRLSPVVKAVLIACGVVFILQLSLSRFGGIPVEDVFGFSPLGLFSGHIWQLFTYPFLHGGLTHLLFNGLMLYMMGTELEARWGSKAFAKFLAICAIGGAILHTLIWLGTLAVDPESALIVGSTPIIGASGALYGVLAAFGMLYGDTQVLVFFVVPMKARYFVIGLTIVEIVSAIFYSNSGVAHLVHLGGLAAGYILMKWKGPFQRGRNGGGGGFFRKKTAMSREEVKSRLKIVGSQKPSEGDKGMPITWN